MKEQIKVRLQEQREGEDPSPYHVHFHIYCCWRPLSVVVATGPLRWLRIFTGEEKREKKTAGEGELG